MKTKIMQSEPADDQSADYVASQPDESAMEHDNTKRSRSMDAATDSAEPRTTTHPASRRAGLR
jgi:hypothetical protein